jgi:hypothetical protein
MFAADYCIDIGQFPRVSGLAMVAHSWRILQDRLYDLQHLAFVVPLWVIAILLIGQRGKKIPRLTELSIGLIAVVLGMVAISIGHCFWQHYFLMGITGLVLLGLTGADALTGYLTAKERRHKWLVCAASFGAFLFVAWTPTRPMLGPAPLPKLVSWEPIVTETIEQRSGPNDYILATEGPLIYAVLNRKIPIPVIGADDGILPYMAIENPQLQMDALREQLERNLPKVCYFAGWYRPRQKLWHELLYDPFLAKYHYVQVNDRLWYLPEDQ